MRLLHADLSRRQTKPRRPADFGCIQSLGGERWLSRSSGSSISSKANPLTERLNNLFLESRFSKRRRAEP